MNFLAHFHLANNEPGLLVGALLGDFVKGPLRGNYAHAIEQGIILHRRIDAHTDQFVISQHLHRSFPPSYRRYLGIMLDLYFDYLLSRDWPNYEQRSLTEFANSSIRVLRKHSHSFPPRGQQFFQRMAEHRLLERYGEEEIQQSILERLSQRLPGNNPLANCWEEMHRQQNVLQPAFVQLYDELQGLGPSFAQ